MVRRKYGYVTAVLLLAVVLSAPQALAAAFFAWVGYTNGVDLISLFGGMNSFISSSPYENQMFWQNGLVSIEFIEVGENDSTFQITCCDPETGHSSRMTQTFAGRYVVGQEFSIGEQIWIETTDGVYELVNRRFEKTNFAMPQILGECFRWNGDPAMVTSADSETFLLSFHDGEFNRIGSVELPPEFRKAQALRTSQWSWRGDQPLLQVLESGGQYNVYFHLNGRLYYRSGLDIQPHESKPFAATAGSPNSLRSSIESDLTLSSGPAEFEADDPIIDFKADGWTLVNQERASWDSREYMTYGLVVGGRPMALTVETEPDGSRIGHYYRFDGASWVKEQTEVFPFGSNRFRATTTPDGSRSFVVAMTTTGATHFFIADEQGFRNTNAQDPLPNPLWVQLGYEIAVPLLTLGLGLMLGLATWGLMWWWTQPVYEFGVQSVKLASLGKRGLARLIDLGSHLASTIALGGLLSRHFEWRTLAEAINLEVGHPAIHEATWIAIVLGAWLALTILANLGAQARWGTTLGKSLCRIKTVRTSLRPCGFARSLAREVVFFVDCGNFLCWTPGIVSIAFTDHMQRLGDLVADTIVIERP